MLTASNTAMKLNCMAMETTTGNITMSVSNNSKRTIHRQAKQYSKGKPTFSSPHHHVCWLVRLFISWLVRSLTSPLHRRDQHRTGVAGAHKRCSLRNVEEKVIHCTARGRGTYTVGTVHSVPLFNVERKSIYFLSHQFDDLMSPKCTKLHRFAPIFAKKFPEITPHGPPKLWRG